MKKIIKYVGGGFFALLISAGLATLVKELHSKWNDVIKMPNENTVNLKEWEEAYTQARLENDVTIEFKDCGGLYARKYLQLEDYFQAIDGTGEEREVHIIWAENVQTGKEVQSKNGRYIFPTAGIYDVYLQCRHRVVKIRVPVNA